MHSLLDNPQFTAAFHRLEGVSLNPRRHLESNARSHSEAVAAAARALAKLNGCSELEQRRLHNLGLAHDIGKLSGSARPEHSLTELARLGVEDGPLLTLVKWHDCNLPWWMAAERGQPPSDKAWRRLAAKLDLCSLCMFAVADRVDAPGGWRRNTPLTWFIAQARARGLVGELALDLPDHASERCAGAAWVHEGRVLLIRARADHYELPKGGIEFDELPEQAALRELCEESGAPASLDIGPELGTLEYRVNGHLKQVRYYTASGSPAEIGPLPAPTRERRWVGIEQLGSLALVSPELEQLLRRALA